MDYQLLKQTRILVKREIEKFLADFPDDHPYQMAMSLANFRQRLETKIVSEVLFYGRVMPENCIEPGSSQFAIKLLGERRFIEDEIRLMMPNIIQNTHLDTYMDTIAVNPSHINYYLITNLQDIIQSSSFNVCQLFNLKQKEIIGQHILFFVPQWQWEKFYYYLDKMKQNISNEEVTEIWSIQLEPFQPQTAPGKLIDVEIETTVHEDTQGKIIGWYWLLQDISQRHTNHQQNYQEVSPIHLPNCRAEAIAYSVV